MERRGAEGDRRHDAGRSAGAEGGDALRSADGKAARFVRSDAEETKREWKVELADDAEELRQDAQRTRERAREIAEDTAHPSRIAEAAKGKAEKLAADGERVVDAVEHPRAVVERAKDDVERRRERINEASAAIADELTGPMDAKRLPALMKAFGGLLMVVAVLLLLFEARSIYEVLVNYAHGEMAEEGLSTIVVTFLHLGVMVLLAAVSIAFGVRLLRNQRRWAALLSYALYVLLAVGALCSIMLAGISARLLFYLGAFVVVIVLQSYLDPTLLAERRQRHAARRAEDFAEGEAGTLGRDLSGKGYISLNFFNLFWIFVVASMVGLLIEELFHYFIVNPGQWQDRAGLLFGPFSPIYGCGAVLMTVFLNRFHKSNPIVIFLVAAVIGGAFEYFTSLFMQYAFGAVAWNYTGMWLSIGGRTCGLFMAMWGLLGVVWIKLVLPFVLHVVNLIPWGWRYAVTAVAAALMLVDAVMSLQALDCWYLRLSQDPVETPIQRFYAEHFDDAYMADRFQSMTIDPGSAVRGK